MTRLYAVVQWCYNRLSATSNNAMLMVVVREVAMIFQYNSRITNCI